MSAGACCQSRSASPFIAICSVGGIIRRQAWPLRRPQHRGRQSPKTKLTTTTTAAAVQDHRHHPILVVASSKGRGRRLRLAFVDFWPGFEDGTDRWLTRSWFEANLPAFEFVPDPITADIVLFTLFGREHQTLRQRGCQAKLIFFTGENVRPPVGKVPLCISFDHVPNEGNDEDSPGALHWRLPLWVFDKELPTVLKMHEDRLNGNSDTELARSRPGFCSWVASNAAMHQAQLRYKFVQQLSNMYKAVACGGECLNNVGGPVDDKLAFLQGHRFNICFENASRPGYCTEKVLHAFAAGAIPIYWGDPSLSSAQSHRGELPEPDFNPKALISAHDYASPEALIRRIEEVDKDEKLFKEYLRQPIFSEKWYVKLRDWPKFCRLFEEKLSYGMNGQG